VVVVSASRAAELMAGFVAKNIVFIVIEENWEEKALQFVPKTLSLGCSLQYWGNVGSWLKGKAIHFK